MSEKYNIVSEYLNSKELTEIEKSLLSHPICQKSIMLFIKSEKCSNYQKRKILTFSVSNDLVCIVDILLKDPSFNYSGMDNLIDIASSDSLDLLIKAGFDPTFSGSKTLVCACLIGDYSIVKQLVLAPKSNPSVMRNLVLRKCMDNGWTTLFDRVIRLPNIDLSYLSIQDIDFIIEKRMFDKAYAIFTHKTFVDMINDELNKNYHQTSFKYSSMFLYMTTNGYNISSIFTLPKTSALINRDLSKNENIKLINPAVICENTETKPFSNCTNLPKPKTFSNYTNSSTNISKTERNWNSHYEKFSKICTSNLHQLPINHHTNHSS